MDSDHVDAMLLKAEIYHSKLKHAEAERLVKKTLILSPHYSRSFVVLATFNMSFKDSKANMKALKLVDKALKIKKTQNDVSRKL